MSNKAPSAGFLTGKRILVVEDEFLIALDIERIFEELEVEVVSVSRNRDALGALQGRPFDLAVLDFKLDGDTSEATADRLVERDVPFIFLTGTSDQTVPARFRDVPVAHKPFDAETLLTALHKAIPT